MALTLADDIVVINTLDGGDRLFSRKLACIECGISMPEMTPRAFSFNSPHGACTECQGLGRCTISIRTASCPIRPNRSLDGAIAPWAKGDRKLVRDAIGEPRQEPGVRSRHAVREPSEERFAIRFFTAATARGSKGSSRIFGGGSRRRRGPSRKISTYIGRCGRARRVMASG